MSDFHHRAMVEFFGGPCDGYRRLVVCSTNDLAPTAFIPLPFMTERWWRPNWMLRSRRQAIYALHHEPRSSSYRYLGTIRRANRGGKLLALARWLRSAIELPREVAFRPTRPVRHDLFDRNV